MYSERDFEELLIINEVVSKKLEEIVELRKVDGNDEEIKKKIDFILERYRSIL